MVYIFAKRIAVPMRSLAFDVVDMGHTGLSLSDPPPQVLAEGQLDDFRDLGPANVRDAGGGRNSPGNLQWFIADLGRGCQPTVLSQTGSAWEAPACRRLDLTKERARFVVSHRTWA